MKLIKRLGLVVIILGICLAVFYFCFLYPRYYPPILMYHRIGERATEKDTFSVPADIFDKQMAFLKARNYKVIPLEELCSMIASKQAIPHNVVAVTFDDGYKDNLAAVDILKKYNLPATIFLILNRVGESGFLNGQDIISISDTPGVVFGSHTLSHRYLPQLAIEDVRNEIFDSKLQARQSYGLDFRTLTYPVGGFRRDVLTEVEEAGYSCACTTNRGYRREKDLYALRRIKITYRDLGIRLWGKLTGFYGPFKRLKPPEG